MPQTLATLPENTPAVVRHVGSDLLDLERLKAMGLCEGQTVRVLRGGERMIVCVCGTRIGISRALASRIEVENAGSPALGPVPAQAKAD